MEKSHAAGQLGVPRRLADIRASATSSTSVVPVAFADGYRLAEAHPFAAARVPGHPADGSARASRHRTGADRAVRRLRVYAARAPDGRVPRRAAEPGAAYPVPGHRRFP